MLGFSGSRASRGFAGLAIALSLTATPLLAQTAPVTGFLAPSSLPDIAAIVPPAPAPGSLDQMRDEVYFLDGRTSVAEPRGQEAAADDVYVPVDVAPRFAGALGVTLTPANAPVTLGLIDRIVKDAENLVKPMKQPAPPGGTGRIRPFVQYPFAPQCPLTPDDIKFHLRESGSYPSTHAMVGWIWASVLVAGAPDRANEVLAKGLAFGESRLVCGFHYRSDVEAGRLAASALMARLAAEPDFVKALQASKLEIAKLRSAAAKTK